MGQPPDRAFVGRAGLDPGILDAGFYYIDDSRGKKVTGIVENTVIRSAYREKF